MIKRVDEFNIVYAAKPLIQAIIFMYYLFEMAITACIPCIKAGVQLPHRSCPLT